MGHGTEGTTTGPHSATAASTTHITSSVGDSTAATSTTAPGTSSSDDRADVDPPALDLAPIPDMPPGTVSCSASRDGMRVGPCSQVAPPDAFVPDVQWSWTSDLSHSYSTPMVANLTDDNGDGSIDLCDVPDVVIVAWEGPGTGADAYIVVLSGDDGSEHFRILGTPISLSVTPALGDIDGDGMVEIIAVQWSFPETLVAFEHDGSLAWESPAPAGEIAFSAPALADLDADGTVEIMMGGNVYTHDGALLFATGEVGFDDPMFGDLGAMPTAADLDGDGDLEVIYGRSAYHHDGSPYYLTGLVTGFPHVANFDDDPDPEILLTNPDGLNLIEHDGTVTWEGARPTGDPAEPYITWLKPGTVHDFDGDGNAEFATGSANNYAVYEIEPGGPSIIWQAPVVDPSGSSGGTAFDFDGDGQAEAMYADELQMFVFDATGTPLFVTPRQSGTGLEYPVVADIDNDGSAEILVVSNLQPPGGSPTIQAIRDVEDRWIPARRIWNQHTYHVTNVREDGTIPTVEPPSWLGLNTFRTNAQIESGQICRPAG